MANGVIFNPTIHPCSKKGINLKLITINQLCSKIYDLWILSICGVWDNGVSRGDGCLGSIKYQNTTHTIHLWRVKGYLSFTYWIKNQSVYVKKSNSWTMDKVYKKWTWYYEISKDIMSKFWGCIWWWSKHLNMFIKYVFKQFGVPSNVILKLTSSCQIPLLWVSSIVQLFYLDLMQSV